MANDKEGKNACVTLSRMKKVREGEVITKKEVKESVWGLVRCCKCERYWDRDFNSALNLYQIVQCALKAESRPQCLQRPKKEDDQQQKKKKPTSKRRAKNSDRPLKKANDNISDSKLSSQQISECDIWKLASEKVENDDPNGVMHLK
ncbi:hypothetical protein RCL1_005738 [Eukaryota sp. TZLM3-RCL]